MSFTLTDSRFKIGSEMCDGMHTIEFYAYIETSIYLIITWALSVILNKAFHSLDGFFPQKPWVAWVTLGTVLLVAGIVFFITYEVTTKRWWKEGKKFYQHMFLYVALNAFCITGLLYLLGGNFSIRLIFFSFLLNITMAGITFLNHGPISMACNWLYMVSVLCLIGLVDALLISSNPLMSITSVIICLFYVWGLTRCIKGYRSAILKAKYIDMAYCVKCSGALGYLALPNMLLDIFKEL